MTYRNLVAAALTAALVPSATAADTAALRETVSVQFQHALPKVPDRNLVAVVVEYPPGAKSSPHRHANSAFIYAHVLSGAVRSQIDDQPARVYRAGEHFHELPGAHHRVSENASDTEPAKLLAVFVVAPGEKLTIPDTH
jgi:quercetin dioxygenase-like cupin family protein